MAGFLGRAATHRFQLLISFGLLWVLGMLGAHLHFCEHPITSQGGLPFKHEFTRVSSARAQQWHKEELTNSSPPIHEMSSWPSTLGGCTQQRSWPSQFAIVSQGTPIQMISLEVEKTDDDFLSILVAGVSTKNKSTSTSKLLKKVLPSLHCDFRRGSIAANGRFGPLHRSRIEMTVIAEDKASGHLLARFRCSLPYASLLDNEDGKKLLPKLSHTMLMDAEQKASEEKKEWLHWQLVHVSQEDVAPKINEWLVAPSLPLCNHDDTPVNGYYDRTPVFGSAYPWEGPNADNFMPRGKAAEAQIQVDMGPALCVMPLVATPSLEAWASSSISDWAYYQLNVAGFSSVFYLDPFGEELLTNHPEISSSFLHVPHTVAHSSLATLMQEGTVAQQLARERCSILARQRRLQYIAAVQDPMDLIIPVQRRRFFLAEALARATVDGCAMNVQMAQVLVQPADYKSEQECDEEWCTLPDGGDMVSKLLMASKVVAIQSPNNVRLHFWHSAILSPDETRCKASVTLPIHTVVQLCSTQGIKGATGFVHDSAEQSQVAHIEQLERILSEDVATWIRHVLRTHANYKKRWRRSAIADWIPISTNDMIPLRMCRLSNSEGPVYGEAMVTKPVTPGKTGNTSALEKVLHLTVYNAEVRTSPVTGSLILSLSTYAEDAQSLNSSFHHEYAWGVLFQSSAVEALLPDVSCVFSHPEPIERIADAKSYRTKGEWTIGEWMLNGTLGLLRWLECPLPLALPLPDLSPLVTIEATSTLAAGMKLHMMHPIRLCIGKDQNWPAISLDEKHNMTTCDGTSLACLAGCVDDAKPQADPQARCCFRCQESHYHYRRFDERDFWTPGLVTSPQGHATEEPVGSSVNVSSDKRSSTKYVTKSQHSSSSSQIDALGGGDLSICTKPFYLLSSCAECDAIDPTIPQRLIEWIEYHLLIGFDVIYVLDRFGTSLRPLLGGYIESGRVILLPFPLLTDMSLSVSQEQSDKMKLKPSSHDQILAWDLCLSLARRRGDAFTALIDTDEFVRYPQPEAGIVRQVIGRILEKHGPSNGTVLPDSIVLDRYDVSVKASGLALGYTRRSRHTRAHYMGKREGKVLARPQALVHGAITVHQACSASGCNGPDSDGTNSLVVPPEEMSVYHYRPGYMLEIKKMEDISLQWAYQIISTQFTSSSGWKAAKALSAQGLLAVSKLRRRENVFRESPAANPPPGDKSSLFIGILSYCAARDRRDAIRRTWLSLEALQHVNALFDVKWRFVLGQPSSKEKSTWCSEHSLNHEAAVFGDLLIMENLAESYNIITRKTLEMFKWANGNANTDFVLKVDDDAYVNVASLVADLLQVETPSIPLYWGSHQGLGHWLSPSFDGGHQTLPSGLSTATDVTGRGRWYLKPEDFPLDSQMYATGAGYLLSKPLVSYLSDMVSASDGGFHVPWGPEDRMGWLEDAAIGYLLRGTVNRAGRLYANGIFDAWFPLICYGDFDFTVIHHVSASHQFYLHGVLHSPQGYTSGACKQLESFQVDLPSISGTEEKVNGMGWGGSFLDRPMSPLNSAAPLPFNPSSGTTKLESLQAPFGRDVVVVTGGLHNIGSHLVETMQQGYARMSGPITVVVLSSSTHPLGGDRKPNFSRFLNSAPHLDVTVNVEQVDITDHDAVLKALKVYHLRIRGVVHLAAVSRVQDCYVNTTRCEEVNEGGTKNILKALWKLYGQGSSVASMALPKRPLPWLLFASSREIYGELRRGQVVDENAPLRPKNIYGGTKLNAEKAIRVWTRKTGFNAVALRFSNVYGSCLDHSSRLIPNMVSKLVADEPFTIFGTSNKTISLLHVQDAVQAILLGIGFAEIYLDNGAGYFEAFNIGGGPRHDVMTVEDIFKTVQLAVASVVPGCNLCNKPPSITKNATNWSHEVNHFRSTITKAFRVLGYKPSRTFDHKMLKKYVENCHLGGLSSHKNIGVHQSAS